MSTRMSRPSRTSPRRVVGLSRSPRPPSVPRPAPRSRPRHRSREKTSARRRPSSSGRARRRFALADATATPTETRELPPRTHPTPRRSPPCTSAPGVFELPFTPQAVRPPTSATRRFTPATDRSLHENRQRGSRVHGSVRRSGSASGLALRISFRAAPVAGAAESGSATVGAWGRAVHLRSKRRRCVPGRPDEAPLHGRTSLPGQRPNLMVSSNALTRG